MMHFSRTRTALGTLAVAALALSACGGTAETTGNVDGAASAPGAEASQSPTNGTTDDGTTDTAMVDGSFDHPVLTTVAIAPDGSTFTAADFAGKTVFIETFATWCGNCRRQLGDTSEAAGQVGDDVVFLALSIEVGLDPAELTAYAADNGFDNVTFGVLDEQGLSAFNDEFGRAVLSAPSTPKFIVSPSGELSELTTGFESVEEILSQIA